MTTLANLSGVQGTAPHPAESRAERGINALTPRTSAERGEP